MKDGPSKDESSRGFGGGHSKEFRSEGKLRAKEQAKGLVIKEENFYLQKCKGARGTVIS